MPLSPGMATSNEHDIGMQLPAKLQHLVAVGRFANNFDFLRAFEQRANSQTDDGMIFGKDDSYRA